MRGKREENSRIDVGHVAWTTMRVFVTDFPDNHDSGVSGMTIARGTASITGPNRWPVRHTWKDGLEKGTRFGLRHCNRSRIPDYRTQRLGR